MRYFPPSLSVSKALCRLLAGALIVLCVCSAALPVRAAGTPPFADGTFIQLVNDNASWTPAQWHSLFKDMQALGMRELVIQWSRYGDTDFMPLVHTVFELAAQYNMRVWVGLYSPADWWTAINKPAQLLEVYLWQVMQAQLQQARAVWAAFGGHAALAGLYLPVEIDDGTWHSAEHTAILSRVMGVFARDLPAIAPQCAVAISGFANGIVPPEALGQFWKSIAQAGNLQRVYFQDGVGVHKLLPQEAARYEQAVARALRAAGRHCVVVVEAFTQVGGLPVNSGPFAAEPAPLSRIRQQVAFARASGAAGVTFFAVPNYMSERGGKQAAALGRAWAQTLR